MIRSPDATRAQVRAADPALSTWLSANAGSGKTRVLTDRVARLLLDGAEPQRILCLTYTKAAAAEMQNRLFQRLGVWAMLPDAALLTELTELGAGAPDAETLARARRLFARAIDAPGGLRIQTIHAFCASLLRRFPLEAGVAPGFTEIEERAAQLMQAEIVEELADGGDVAAVDAVAGLMSGEDFTPLLEAISKNAEAFATPLGRSDIWGLFGLAPDFDAAHLVKEVFLGGEAALIAALVPIMAAGKETDLKNADRLAAVPLANPDSRALEALEAVFLYGARTKSPFGAKIGDIPTKAVREGAAAPLMPALEALMLRVEAARERRVALAAARKSLALHRFAAAFLPRYAARKAQRGWLDFDDLIARAAALLNDRSVAQWVLFRLDGGIDHILVDEAQDTSPRQWAVIERLAEEFTTGASVRPRTLFVVGDKKQSIYSFQGADLAEFERMRAHFDAKFAAVQQPLQMRELQHSFRSSEAILRLVDLTLAGVAEADLGGPVAHRAAAAAKCGRVDLWPLIEPEDKADAPEWDNPQVALGDQLPAMRLAAQIAAEVKRMIDAGTMIDTRDTRRALHEGDILVLVQGRKTALFGEIIRACKAAGLNVAGADRLKLGAELAVRDLGALLAFVVTPDDDLSLAAALRSPLFGLSEDGLFRLSQGRAAGETLWARLRADPGQADNVALLADLMDRSDFLRPFELIERVLTRHSGRLRLIARLGREAEDGIDELLAQALSYERVSVPSLTGFLVWLHSDDVEVKRRQGADARALRVMTVHGAKGLEAPVVILPDTLATRADIKDEVLLLDGGQPVWKTTIAVSPALIAARRAAMVERKRQEKLRLLYVAMTRAESWLIVCGAGALPKSDATWFSLVSAGMARAAEDPELRASTEDTGFGRFRRLAFGDWPADQPGAESAPGTDRPLPDWAQMRLAAASGPLATLSPSNLGGAKALAGEGDLPDAEAAQLHGSQLHLLLEHLPQWPEADWPEVARLALASGEAPAGPDIAASLLAEAARVLAAPDLAPYLGADALTEVEITAALPELGGRRIMGAIDRLLVTPDRVTAIDYKSNHIVPDCAQDVPEGLMRQMGAYAAALAQIYPGRRIETAILWTATGHLMPLDPDIVRTALQATTIP